MFENNNNNNNNPIPDDGFFGNPLAFGCSDLRALNIIAAGINQLNDAAAEGGIEAAAKLLPDMDPVVRMAVLTRFREQWNTMVNTMATVASYFKLFGQPQVQEEFHTFLQNENATYTSVQRGHDREIEARLEHGFDTPWDASTPRDEGPKEPTITDEENRRADFLLNQLDLGNLFNKE